MEDYDVGDMLKKLDDLDTKHYTPISYSSSQKMATDQNQNMDDDNMSDFDNSEEDLASLLGDEDDDIFAKKIYGNSPTKSAISEEPITKKTKEKSSILSPVTESSVSKSAAEDSVDDILDHFIDTSTTFQPSLKKRIEHSEENYSPSKQSHSPKSQLLKNNDESIDSFSSAENKISEPSKERRESFFDDFLQTLSPNHKEKKDSIPKLGINTEKEDDILSTYMPTTPKQIESVVDTVIKSPKRKGSLFKQVSFKDITEDFLETDVIDSKTDAASTDSKKEILPESKIETDHRVKRKEKLGLNKKEDMDWENFFKETPKQSKEISKRKGGISIPKTVLPSNKQDRTLKRQSSADWLGLNENSAFDDGAFEEKANKKTSKRNIEATMSAQRNHIDSSMMHQPQLNQNELNEWNDTDFVSVETNDIGKSGTPLVSPQKKSPLPFSRKNTFETSVISSTQASVNNPEIHSTSNKPPRSVEIDTFSSQLQLQTLEQTKAIHSLQTLLDESMLERNKLLKENETIKQVYEEKIKAIEDLYRSGKKSSEDLHKTLESSLQKEYEIKIKVLEERLDMISNEKSKQESILRDKLESIYKDHQVEMQRLKELHNEALNMMKKDHEEAISRLQKLKNQEVETVISSHAHTKSLQYLSDQLQAQANELAVLQNKVEERNQISLKERQTFLDARETNLKALESRLQKQSENSESERIRLQQLVLRLEDRLQKLTIEGEEDRYEVLQMKAKLKVQLQYLEEEKKLNQHHIEKEKEKLRISQDSLLHEQKTVLLQLAQERQLFVQEKIDLQALSKYLKEEEAKLNVKKVKEENDIQSQKQHLQQEENEIHFDKERVKQEFYQLEREQNSLQREKQQIRGEREKLLELDAQLKRKSVECEELSLKTRIDVEKAHREYNEAVKIKAEQQVKIEKYAQDMQILMEKERHILLEKDKLIKEKLELEESKQSVLCTRCKIVANTIQAPTELHMPVMYPVSNIHGITSQVQQPFADPNLVIWHLAAQKDREFLQEELAYLQSLKASTQN